MRSVAPGRECLGALLFSRDLTFIVQFSLKFVIMNERFFVNKSCTIARF